MGSTRNNSSPPSSVGHNEDLQHQKIGVSKASQARGGLNQNPIRARYNAVAARAQHWHVPEIQIVRKAQ